MIMFFSYSKFLFYIKTIYISYTSMHSIYGTYLRKKPKGVMDPFGLERGEEGLFPSCHSFWIVMATGLGILFLCFLYVVLQLCAFPASLSESRPLFKSRLLVLRSPHFKAKGNNYLPLSDRAIASHLFLPWIMNLIPKLGVWHAVGAPPPLHIVYNGFFLNSFHNRKHISKIL